MPFCLFAYLLKIFIFVIVITHLNYVRPKISVMSIKFKTRIGSTYFVKSKQTKKGNTTYYLTKKEDNDRKAAIFLDSFVLPSKMAKLQENIKQFNAYMKIKLIEDGDYREFVLKRFCYRSSIDDWIFIDCDEEIKPLVENSLYHLGKESFYELM